MRLTVLGSAASYAGAGEACAGYLLETAEVAILLDCGNGVLANLARLIDPLTLDAVFVSHGHPDHFLDLYAMQSLLRYAPQGPAPAMPLHAPAGLFDGMLSLHSGGGAEDMREAFEVHDLAAASAVVLGDVTLTPLASSHMERSFGFVLDGPGSRLAYTSDTRPCPEADAIAAGADVLLAEATLPEAYAGRAPHMTAREAGELATRARASRLVLTHIWPTNDREAMRREAREAFDGEVLIAEEMLVVEL